MLHISIHTYTQTYTQRDRETETDRGRETEIGEGQRDTERDRRITHTEIRGQHEEATSSLLLCVNWGLNSNLRLGSKCLCQMRHLTGPHIRPTITM